MAASRFLSGNGAAARAGPDQARNRNKAAAGAAGDIGLPKRFMAGFSGSRSIGRVSAGAESSPRPEPSGCDGSSIRGHRAGEKGRQGAGGVRGRYPLDNAVSAPVVEVAED